MLEIDNYTPKENWFVGLLFEEGYWVIRLVRKQQRTIYRDYAFNDGNPIASGDVSNWETPTDTEGRYYLEPQDQSIVYQFFVGISPSIAHLYLAYPKRQDRMSLITPRDVPGNIGYWSGEDTPYNDPSPETEMWAVKDLVPYFVAENPAITGKDLNIYANFFITPFSYKVVRDINLIKQFINGEKRCRMITMGDPEKPISAPAWLKEQYGNFIVKVEED